MDGCLGGKEPAIASDHSQGTRFQCNLTIVTSLKGCEPFQISYHYCISIYICEFPGGQGYTSQNFWLERNDFYTWYMQDPASWAFGQSKFGQCSGSDKLQQGAFCQVFVMSFKENVDSMEINWWYQFWMDSYRKSVGSWSMADQCVFWNDWWVYVVFSNGVSFVSISWDAEQGCKYRMCWF